MGTSTNNENTGAVNGAPSHDRVPTVEILIPSYNCRKVLADCLRSIGEHSPDPRTASLIVSVLDNASPDGLGDMVASDFPWVHLVRSAENIGYTRGNNHLATESSADYLLLLNSDTVLEGDIVGPLLTALREHPEAAGVAAGLVWPDGSPQPSTSALPTLRIELARVAQGTRWSRLIPFLGNPEQVVQAARHVAVESPPVQRVPFVWSTCILIRGDLVASEGLYDERFVQYDADLDWCTRQIAKGRTVLFDPGVKVIHIGGASRTPAERRRSELESRRTYHRIHRGPLGGFAYACILRLDLWLTRLRARRRPHVA